MKTRLHERPDKENCTVVNLPDDSGGHIITPTYTNINETFAPYVRHDGPDYSPLYEILKTILCSVTLFPLRLTLLLWTITISYLMAKVVLCGHTRGNVLQSWRLTMVQMILWPNIRLCLFSLGVLWIHQSKQDLPMSFRSSRSSCLRDTKAHVVISNHLSWLDIVVLLVLYPRMSFLAKSDLEHVPIIGVLASALETMYIPHECSTTTILLERVQVLASATTDGHCRSKAHRNVVCVFPEGTTTNGRGMIGFRTGIFRAGEPIQLLVLRYPARHWSLSWESVYFRRHVFRTMTQIVNFVHVVTLPTYVPSKEEIADPGLFAANVQQCLAQVAQQPIYPLNRKHKGLYHQVLLDKCSPERALAQAQTLAAEDPTLVRLSTRVSFE